MTAKLPLPTEPGPSALLRTRTPDSQGSSILGAGGGSWMQGVGYGQWGLFPGTLPPPSRQSQ